VYPDSGDMLTASVRVMAAVEDITGCIWLSHNVSSTQCTIGRLFGKRDLIYSDNLMLVSKDTIWCMIMHMDSVQTLMGI